MSYINFFNDGELREYLFSRGLNLLQTSLFMLLQSLDKYAEQHGNFSGTTVSNSRLAKELGVSSKTITTALAKLQEKGLIKLTYNRSSVNNTKRLIKPIKLIEYSLDSQATGIIGYINKFLDNTSDNLETLNADDQETKNQVKKAIAYFGSDTKLISYINSHREKFIDFYSVQDWLEKL